MAEQGPGNLEGMRKMINYAPDNGFGGGLGGGEPEDNHEKENEAESQKYTRRESLSDELINGAETPEELFLGLRQLEKQLDDGNIPQGLSERYTPPRQLSAMYERADMLSYKIDDLIARKWVTEYNPNSGEAKLKDRRFAALAIKAEQVERTDEKGRYIGFEMKYNLGTPESREKLEKAYKRAVTELEARDIMGEHIGVRLNIEIRDSLESLTAIMHGGRMPKFKADHLEAIFNMPGLSELESNPENKQLGDQVEEAMFCNLVMLSSGNKERMLDLLKRPGATHLIRKMAKEEEARRQKINGENYRYSENDWYKDNIGDVNAWVDDDNRLLTDKGGAPATWRVEAGDNRRGTLTKWSNIAAWGGGPAEFGADKEADFIEKTIGGLTGSIEASWVAATMMRVIGAYASEGYVALPNGKDSHLPLGEGRYISGDDTGKFYAYMFNMKEGRKGRTSGLKDMIGRVPDLAMNLFDWAAVTMPDLPPKDGLPQKRSIWDAWLGTAAGKPIKDLLTGKDTPGMQTTMEPYHRLGDLNFKSLEREFHGTFTIMQWLMGNGERPTGVFIEAMSDDFKFEDFGLNKLKKIWKYIDIVMNPVVLTKGSPHLYNLGVETAEQVSTYDLINEGVGKFQIHEVRTKNVDTIKRRYFKNLMAARIRSSAFTLGILPRTEKVYNPGSVGASFVEIPSANLVELFVNEAMRDKEYSDEAKVVEHYIDDITRLGGVNKDMKNVAEIRNKAKSWLNGTVGRVMGKKS